jgi:predicted nucleic acid-binding Zn ribbon protein
MPKRITRHNPESLRVGASSVRNSRNPLRAPESVKSLLSRISQSARTPVAEQRQAQQDWREWLKKRLPDGLDAHITGVVERGRNLTVFADSAAWSARLRFAVADLDAEIRGANASIQKVLVKVLPRR